MRQYSIYRKGEITVFLSLVFLAIISFIAVVIRGSRDAYIRQKVETVTDMAIRSSFSEYNKRLYDKYGLLYIDTTYLGAELGGKDCLVNHIESYVDVNLLEDANGIYDVSLCSVEVCNVVFANQHNYDSLVNQIRTYMIKNKGFSATKSDEEIIDGYIELKMPADFYERFVTQPSYDEKLNETIMEIEKDIKQTTNSVFSFQDQIESATVGVVFESGDGKTYECTRYYSLSM